MTDKPPLLVRRDNIVARVWGRDAGTWTWHCRRCRYYSTYCWTQNHALTEALAHCHAYDAGR